MKRKSSFPSASSSSRRRNASEERGAAPAAQSPSSVQVAPSGRGQAVVSRERAFYFATGEREASSVTVDAEETKESWPGYFSTAQQLSENRQAAQAARKQRQEVKRVDEQARTVVWTPKRPARSSVLGADDVVDKLRNLALKCVAENIEQLPTLEYIDATARHQVARAASKLRRLRPEILPLFIFPGVTEIDIPDCSNIDEETLLHALKQCAAHGLVLTVLRLGLCGRCVSDRIIDELRDALKTVEQMQLKGCYRLSDAGCQMLVQRCVPSLDSFELSCNQRITKKSIDSFCELQNLHSLTLSECPQIDDASLESLKSMKSLRRLKLNQLERLSDEFIVSLAQKLFGVEEFSIARCSQLTDNAVKAILEACRGLKVLDVSDLHQITDGCFEPVRKYGHPLRRISMRCCIGLTDVALEHIAFGANKYLETLKMSSVTVSNFMPMIWIVCDIFLIACKYAHSQQVTDASVMALLEHCATSLRTLDISFCRNISEDALGVLVDGTESIRSLVLWGCTQVCWHH
ncbi:hypothetical protein PsorP6_014109 [Peronosclerospora sorghi]|uniref:Uncharacterized protein n=1 Tax=Peronosclerospora sorghi TaxID=230839 RepID=A0ACC0VHF5_9STRA|nr:hypothetical protein PsorP6_014109 [Peronosclerospora sorghi]